MNLRNIRVIKKEIFEKLEAMQDDQNESKFEKTKLIEKDLPDDQILQ